MTRNLLILLLLLSCSINKAQTLQHIDLEEFNDMVYQNKLFVDKTAYKDFMGRPYYEEDLTPGNIVFASGKSIEDLPMRYNWYSERMEFEHEGKVLEIPTRMQISYILIDSIKYVPFYYVKKFNGYLVECYKGNILLYKKEDIRYIQGKPPQSGYHEAQPPQFEWAKPLYYVINSDAEITRLEKSKKKLASQFPEYKSKLLAYIKAESLNPKREEELIKIIAYLDKLMQEKG